MVSVVVSVVLSVVVVSSVLLQEMKVRLKRRMREMRMMSRCFTDFPISVLVEPNIYQNLVRITRKWGDRVVDVSI